MTTTPPEPDQPFGANQPPYPGAQQPPAAPSYGAYPTDPAGAPRQGPPAPPRPPSMSLAVKLMYAGAGLTLLGLVYSLTTIGSLKDDVRDRLLENDPSTTQSVIDASYGVTIVSIIVGPLIAVGLWLWMAWKNGQGRSWARVVATVLGAINVLFTLIGLAASAEASAIGIVVSIVQLVLAGAILVLLYRKESTAFYQGTAASRRLY